MTVMLAARAHRGQSELQLEKIEIPEPGPQDVLVKVVSAGLAPGMMILLARGAFKHRPATRRTQRSSASASASTPT